MKKFSATGFTIVELLVTVSMIAIVLAVGVPAVNTTIRNSVLTAGINEFVAALNFARGESIKRGVNVTVRKTSSMTCTSTTCTCTTTSTVGYEGGWQVFTDANADGCEDPTTDSVLRVHESLKTLYTLWGNSSVKNYISYQPDGTSQNFGSFALCDGTQALTSTAARGLVVNTLGRATMATVDSNGILQNSSGTEFNSCASP